tara:strand:+ start:256 stop:570 length:315 start_codon:yes stop_codon:yes gene_type:complete
MKQIKLFLLFSALFVVLNGCSTFTEAGQVLRNEKTKSTDEFLIKKQEPLTQPPDFNIIPVPGSTTSKTKENQNSVEKLLKNSKSNNSKTKSSSTENSILNQIKK